MLRSVFASLGLGSHAASVSVRRTTHSPFSKTAKQMSNIPHVLLSRPLTLSTSYPAATVTQIPPKQHSLLAKAVRSAMKQNSLFGEDNPDTTKKWLGNYLKNINLRMKFAKIEKVYFEADEQFVAFNKDKLMNGRVVVYPTIITDRQIQNNIFNLAKKQKKTLGVLQLTKSLACWKVMFPGNFWIALIPHDLLKVYRPSPHANQQNNHHQHLHKK